MAFIHLSHDYVNIDRIDLVRYWIIKSMKSMWVGNPRPFWFLQTLMMARPSSSISEHIFKRRPEVPE
jgi:hypothetical protein